MSRQDADDIASGTPMTDGGETEAEDNAADSANEGQTEEEQEADPEIDEAAPGEESLDEIAKEPDGDAEEVLSELAEGSVDELAVDPAGVDVPDSLEERVESLSTAETARLVAALQAAVDEKAEALAAERERADDLESRLARKQADFQNYKERQQREQERIRKQTTEDVVEQFVEIRDNLVRALDQDENADIRNGVDSTLSLFDDKLDREGVSVIDPEPGVDPDPRRHEVLATMAGEQPSGTIAETHRPGYEMDDSVIRPAQVAVSDGSLAADADDSEHDEEKADNAVADADADEESAETDS